MKRSESEGEGARWEKSRRKAGRNTVRASRRDGKKGGRNVQRNGTHWENEENKKRVRIRIENEEEEEGGLSLA